MPGISTTGSECWPEEDAWLGGRTTAKPRWSEVMIFLDVFLRRKGCCREVVVSSDEEGAHRRTASCPVSQLRGATAGRRRLRGERLYSGEAEVVGGNRLLGSPPPADVSFTKR